MKLLFGICLLLIGGALANKHTLYTDDAIEVSFEGNSGKIKVARSDSNLELSFDTLQEVTNQGAAVGSPFDFKTRDFTWTDPVSKDNKIKVRLDTKLDNGANFNVTAWLYQTEQEETQGETTFTVKKNHVKFSVAVEYYPFAAATNKLDFSCAVKFKGGKGFPKAKEEGEDEGTSKVVVGPGEIEVLDSVLVDGAATPLTTELVEKGAFTGITFHFPHFDDTLEYDPTLGLSSASLASPSLLLVLLALAANLFRA